MNGALLAAACGVCLLCCALAKSAGGGGPLGFGGLNLGNNLGDVLARIGSTIGDNGESVIRPGRQYKVIIFHFTTNGPASHPLPPVLTRTRRSVLFRGVPSGRGELHHLQGEAGLPECHGPRRQLYGSMQRVSGGWG